MLLLKKNNGVITNDRIVYKKMDDLLNRKKSWSKQKLIQQNCVKVSYSVICGSQEIKDFLTIVVMIVYIQEVFFYRDYMVHVKCKIKDKSKNTPLEPILLWINSFNYNLANYL